MVVSPAVGGIVPGYETARQLGAKAIFVERENGKFALRRGFEIEPGAKVLTVEDIVTTGLSVRETLDSLQSMPAAKWSAAACLIDRSGGKADVGVPLRGARHHGHPQLFRRRSCRPSSPPCRR